jgi:hypothetical protein
MQILAGVDSGAVPTSFESIATTTVGAGGQATITFSSIPSTYKHLQIRFMSKSNNTNDAIDMRFNSDTGNNYSYHELFGDGSSAGSGASTPRSTIPLAGGGAPAANTNVFGVSVVDILDYADTNKFKTIRNLGGVDFNGSGVVMLISGNWRSTSAVSTISLALRSNNVGQYSSFALYGIKG